MQWRITGVRRWLPVLLLACFGASAVLVLAGHAPASAWRPREVAQLVFHLVGVACAVVLVLVARRTRVRLGATGVEVRGGKRSFVGYDEITRVYRDRFTSGGITLMLADDTKVVLPAPVAGLGVGSPEVDAAVEQIRARLPTGA